MKTSLLLFVCVLLIDCSNDIKFDKTKWQQVDDLQTYPYRLSMLRDLTSNYKLKGLSYSQLVALIGEPQKNLIGDSNHLYYPIVTDFGTDIDPVHTITLEIMLNNDSIVDNFKVAEWEINE